MNKIVTIILFFLGANTAFAKSDSQTSSWSSILMLVAFLVFFYLFLIRPQVKRGKEQRRMLSEISEGDEVITSSGVLGKISKISNNYFHLEISDQVYIKIQKTSISNLLPKGSIKNA